MGGGEPQRNDVTDSAQVAGSGITRSEREKLKPVSTERQCFVKRSSPTSMEEQHLTTPKKMFAREATTKATLCMSALSICNEKN